tara:strand:- start:4626 stop:5840 length:1215 start_codon:yes stop_codon:yes gene_type:complete
MNYKNNNFYIEKIKAENLIRKYGSPIYCYSNKKLVENINNFKDSFKSFSPLICFSVKSNYNSAILKIIKEHGLGADVVSDGELKKVLSLGFKPNKIVYSGVGKKFEELKFAISKNILLINVESESEIKNIQKLAKRFGKKVSVGLRLNPNIDAKTNTKISTGRMQDKFGLNSSDIIKILKKFKDSGNIKIKCLSVHIGSQITKNKPYNNVLVVINKILSKSRYKFEYIDLGGGMGIKYNKNNKKLDYSKLSKNIFKFSKKNDCKIIFEPGRSIVGNTAVLLTKVIYIKNNSNKKFIIIDAGMNDLIRPALYNATHDIIPLTKKSSRNSSSHDFVGPICETSDRFLKTKNYQKINEGDNLAIKDVGAYGIVLASNYNLRPRPIEIIINNSNIKKISKKQTLNDII